MIPAIQQFIQKLPDEKRKIALQARDIFIQADSDIIESIKWSQLTFSYKKSNFAFIYTYPKAEYMNIGFFYALSLSDPDQLFEGSGKSMRHIKVYPGNEIPVEQLIRWIEETIRLLK